MYMGKHAMEGKRRAGIMSDMKKLFKRDYLYWLIVSLVMLGLLVYMRLNVSEKYLNKPIEIVRR